MAAFLRQLKIGSNSKQDNVVQSHEYHMPIKKWCLLPIKEQFEEEGDNQINRIRRRNYNKQNNWKMVSSKNYYPRPSPPDIQYEERSKFRTTKYDGDSIYEWNIDGKAEYEVLNNLQEMGMARLAYKITE